jgi:hypothetical protein
MLDMLVIAPMKATPWQSNCVGDFLGLLPCTLFWRVDAAYFCRNEYACLAIGTVV